MNLNCVENCLKQETTFEFQIFIEIYVSWSISANKLMEQWETLFLVALKLFFFRCF